MQTSKYYLLIGTFVCYVKSFHLPPDIFLQNNFLFQELKECVSLSLLK